MSSPEENPGLPPKEAGEVLSFYAPATLVKAIRKYIKDHRGNRRGEASAWFVEAAQRDLRARGVGDGSSPANDRETALTEFAELLKATSPEKLGEVRERVAELRLNLSEVAGAAVTAGR
jgi:hypothetical protein